MFRSFAVILVIFCSVRGFQLGLPIFCRRSLLVWTKARQAVYCDLRSRFESSFEPDLPLFRLCHNPPGQPNTLPKRTQISQKAKAIATKITKNQPTTRNRKTNNCITMTATSEAELEAGRNSVKHLSMKSHEGSVNSEKSSILLASGVVSSYDEGWVCLTRR